MDNFPTDKVRLPGGCYGKSPLENIYGGFEYVCRYSDNFVYKTGCGLYVKGRNVIGNMSTAGIDWCYENDNPVIRCPYDKPDCPQNDPKLYGTQGGGLCIQCWCVCHRTKDDYNYNASVEKKNDERLEEEKRKYKELVEKRHGRAEIMHIITNAQENGISTIDLNGARTGAKETMAFVRYLAKNWTRKKAMYITT